MRRFVLAVAGWLVAFPVVAIDLTVLVDDGHGRPVADAVVMVVPSTVSDAHPRPAQSRTIDQKALTFVPYLQVFRPGDAVVFHNSDDTRHHVYSFSPAKAFEFVLAPGEHSSPQVLDKAGVIAVGCNIHDQMVAYLYVTDAPWAIRTGEDGVARIEGLAPGAYEVRVWQPRLRPNDPIVRRGVTVDPMETPDPVRFSLSLLPDPRRQFDRERVRY